MYLNQRSVGFGLAFALLAVGLFGVTGDAKAQDGLTQTNLEVTVDSFDEPIRPLSGSMTKKVTVTWSGVKYAANSQLTPIQVTLSVKGAPTWVTATLSPSVVFLSPDQGKDKVEAKADLTISTLADAPARTPASFDITATTSGEGNAYEGTTGTGRATVMADYFSLFDIQMPTTLQTGRPQEEIAYPIVVRNLGNGETKVFFEVKDKPEGWQVVEPSPITLPRGNAGKPAEGQVMLMLQTPKKTGYMNDVGVVTMEITSVYAFDGTVKGDRTVVSVLSTAKGFDVPAPAGFGMILPLLGAAATLATRRL